MRRVDAVGETAWCYRPNAPAEASPVVGKVATPLRLVDQGLDWDPAQGWMGDLADELPECLVPVIAAGPRRAYEFEQVVPGDDDPYDDGPILRALDAAHRGDRPGARRMLKALLAADVRCLDAHAHLGAMAFEFSAKRALPFFAEGVAIGELSIWEGFDGVLPWGLIDNRPFLRSLHGLGLCLWRLEDFEAALQVFDALLWLNPVDDQGARDLIALVRAGHPWPPQDSW